jgi:hypothetical protein
MIKDLVVWSVKLGFQMLFWLYIFSFEVGGQTLFYKARSLASESTIIAVIDEEVSDLWYKVTETAKATFAKISEDYEKKLN